ncbi:MAG: hypothetical protein HKP58_03435 [Desulfatitalea sp.]|nr:YebG family protein [Desulfatitalea sp.]NNJ99445.1 hypothetical protein [Desulfatitalea sp.]
MADISRAEAANAIDRVTDAAAELAGLVEAAGVQMDEMDLEELTIFLAKNAVRVRAVLKPAIMRART